MDESYPTEAAGQTWRILLVVGSRNQMPVDGPAISSLPWEAAFAGDALADKDTLHVESVDGPDGSHYVDWLLHDRDGELALAHAVSHTSLLLGRLQLAGSVEILDAQAGRLDDLTSSDASWRHLSDRTDQALEISRRLAFLAEISPDDFRP